MYEYQHLLDARAADPVCIFAKQITDQEDSIDTQTAIRICKNNYAGDNQFSWDGILDDLTDLVGYDIASNILRHCD